MLVKDCMTRHPIMIASDTPAAEAEKIMSESNIRHVPVVGDGKRLEGLITRQRLAFKPSTLASLDVWEITRYLSDLKVKKLMLKRDEVYTITADQTVEQASRKLTDFKIGCLPVIQENDVVVGIISEIDLLRSLQEMLGLPSPGVRVTVRMPNQRGEFSKLTGAIASHGWGILGIGSFPTPRHPGFYDLVLKIPEVTPEEVQAALSQVPEQEVIDIRQDTP